jgi:predicted nucleic acid-binding protein
MLADEKIQYSVSTALIFEYEDVLKRPDKALIFTDDEIDQILDSIVAMGHCHASHFLWRPFLKDPKDDMILELAVVSGADRIVTHNLKDFNGSEQLGIKAVTPYNYMKKEKLL